MWCCSERSVSKSLSGGIRSLSESDADTRSNDSLPAHRASPALSPIDRNTLRMSAEEFSLPHPTHSTADCENDASDASARFPEDTPPIPSSILAGSMASIAATGSVEEELTENQNTEQRYLLHHVGECRSDLPCGCLDNQLNHSHH